MRFKRCGVRTVVQDADTERSDQRQQLASETVYREGGEGGVEMRDGRRLACTTSLRPESQIQVPRRIVRQGGNWIPDKHLGLGMQRILCYPKRPCQRPSIS